MYNILVKLVIPICTKRIALVVFTWKARKPIYTHDVRMIYQLQCCVFARYKYASYLDICQSVTVRLSIKFVNGRGDFNFSICSYEQQHFDLQSLGDMPETVLVIEARSSEDASSPQLVSVCFTTTHFWDMFNVSPLMLLLGHHNILNSTRGVHDACRMRISGSSSIVPLFCFVRGRKVLSLFSLVCFSHLISLDWVS